MIEVNELPTVGSAPTREQTIEAIKGSVAKWQAVVDGTGKEEGSVNCPLCQLFQVDRQWPLRCIGCPVADKTGKRFCHDTPYDEYCAADDHSNEDEMEEAAKAELAFLTGLLAEWEARP